MSLLQKAKKCIDKQPQCSHGSQYLAVGKIVDALNKKTTTTTTENLLHGAHRGRRCGCHPYQRILSPSASKSCLQELLSKQARRIAADIWV